MWNIWKPQCQVHNQKNASCPGISAEQIDWHVQKYICKNNGVTIKRTLNVGLNVALN